MERGSGREHVSELNSAFQQVQQHGGDCWLLSWLSDLNNSFFVGHGKWEVKKKQHQPLNDLNKMTDTNILDTMLI